VKTFLDANYKKVPQFKDNLPGNSWYCSFLDRHKVQLSARKSQNIKISRATVTAAKIGAYFDALKGTVRGVMPEAIVNYDEKNITDDPGVFRVIVCRSSTHTDRILDTSKVSTSVMFSGTASGFLLPPYVVYEASNCIILGLILDLRIQFTTGRRLDGYMQQYLRTISSA